MVKQFALLHLADARSKVAGWVLKTDKEARTACRAASVLSGQRAEAQAHQPESRSALDLTCSGDCGARIQAAQDHGLDLRAGRDIRVGADSHVGVARLAEHAATDHDHECRVA